MAKNPASILQWLAVPGPGLSSAKAHHVSLGVFQLQKLLIFS